MAHSILSHARIQAFIAGILLKFFVILLVLTVLQVDEK